MDEEGKVLAAWYDRRLSTGTPENYLIDVFATTSTDGKRFSKIFRVKEPDPVRLRPSWIK